MPKCSVEREGSRVIVAVRDGKKSATLTLTLRASGALAALVGAAVQAEDASAHARAFEAECGLDGELETNEQR